jgi:hypothetical protein
MYSHRHPVIQKVLIGAFVWGMMLFSMKVAYGQMQLPDMDTQASALPNFTFPVDMSLPTKIPMPTSLPPQQVAVPTIQECGQRCMDAATACTVQAGSGQDAMNLCGVSLNDCNTACMAADSAEKAQ